MSGTANAPPLEASGGDPIIAPPPPPPLNASNHPDDRAAGVAPEATAEERAALAKAKAAPTTDAAPPAEGAKPTPKADETPAWMKAEITKTRNAERAAKELAAAAETRATEAQTRLDAALESLKALTPKPPPEPPADPRPLRDSFDSPEAYDAAIEGWGARVAERAGTEAREAATREAREAAEKTAKDAADAVQRADVEALAATWSDRYTAAKAKWSDYDEVAGRDDITISTPMAEAIMRSEVGPDVAYHLGKNPEEAARIAALPTVGAQLFEMGRLAERVAQPAPVRVSRASDPIQPISGTREGATDTDREETMAEVAARVSKRDMRRSSTFGSRPN